MLCDITALNELKLENGFTIHVGDYFEYAGGFITPYVTCQKYLAQCTTIKKDKYTGLTEIFHKFLLPDMTLGKDQYLCVEGRIKRIVPEEEMIQKYIKLNEAIIEKDKEKIKEVRTSIKKTKNTISSLKKKLVQLSTNSRSSKI